MPNPYVHNVDPEKYTLTTSGPVYPGETGTIITGWGSEKKFNTHLEKAKLRNEKLLAQNGKPPADEPGSLVAGSEPVFLGLVEQNSRVPQLCLNRKGFASHN